MGRRRCGTYYYYGLHGEYEFWKAEAPDAAISACDGRFEDATTTCRWGMNAFVILRFRPWPFVLLIISEDISS